MENLVSNLFYLHSKSHSEIARKPLLLPLKQCAYIENELLLADLFLFFLSWSKYSTNCTAIYNQWDMREKQYNFHDFF